MPFGSWKNKKVVTTKDWIEENTKEVQEEDMDEEEDEDIVVVEEHYLFSLIVEKWATSHDFVPNHAHFVGTSKIQRISQKIVRICWQSGKRRKCTAIW
jgi:hypothetical protein